MSEVLPVKTFPDNLKQASKMKADKKKKRWGFFCLVIAKVRDATECKSQGIKIRACKWVRGGVKSQIKAVVRG